MRQKTIKKIFYLTLVVFNGLLYSFSPSKAINFLQHKMWTMEDGLPINSLTAITQSADGFLWIGSEAGLIRFDGVSFETFNHENVPLFTGDIVYGVIEDRQGTIWTATRGDGVIRFKKGKFDSLKKEDGLLCNQISCLMESTDGLIWVGTRNGLNIVNKGEITSVPLPETLTTTWITCLYEDDGGRIWIGTYGDGLVKIKPKNDEYECRQIGPGHIKVTAFLEDRNGVRWIGTREKGLITFQQDRFYNLTTHNGLSNNYISCLFEDRSGNLWIGTQGGGIDFLPMENRGRSSGQIIFPLPLQQEFLSSIINSIYKDHEGTIWIATLGGGLSSLRETNIHTYTTRNGLSTDNVYGVFADSKDQVWVGSRDCGANYLKDGHFYRLTKKEGLSSLAVVSFAESPGGVLWFGTLGGGINRLKNGHIDVFDKRSGLPSNFVRAIISSSPAEVWAATVDGHILHYKENSFRLIADLKYRVNTLYKDNNWQLWAGTFDKGLYCIDCRTGKTEVFDLSRGLSHNTVLCIHKDELHPGILWIGTIKGLNCFQRGKFKKIFKKDGLPDDTFYWILEDHKHDFWISSNRGIYCLKYKDIDAIITGEIGQVRTVLYGKKSGMRSIECNGGNHPAGCKTKDGKLWFPTTHGLSVIDPIHISLNRISPPLAFKKVIINGKDTPIEGNPQISPGRNEIEIYYTALSFIEPRKILFRYKLEGYDRDWKESQERWVRYTNLPPGSYCFRITACNSDGVWNKKGISLDFKLKSEFYKTPLFIIFCLFGIGLVVLLFYSFRRKPVLGPDLIQKNNRSSLDPELTCRYVQKLLYLLEVEKIYKDPNISVKSLASRLLISSKNLSRIINDHLNTTFFELVTQHRMKEAQRILSEPGTKGKSVLDVAYEVGYNSKSAFNRAFKNITSMTPSQFRKKSTSKH